MAINTDYYGAADTWVNASTTNAAGKIDCKIADITGTTANVERGSLQYLWGKEFSQTGNSQVTVDRSFCFIAMDKNAPQNKVRLSSGCISSAADLSDRYALIDVIPTKDVPFGWSLNGSSYNLASTRIYTDSTYNYTSFANAPVNYKPLFLSPAWVPTNGKSGDHWYVRYFGYQCAPILSWEGYKSVKLVPLVLCGELKAGKDPSEVTTYADIYQVYQNIKTYDLKTYLTGTVTVGGETKYVYERNRYVFQIGVIPYKILFSGGVATSYQSVDSGSISAGTGTLYPSPMYTDAYDFLSHYKANPSSYGDSIQDMTASPMLAASKRMSDPYISYYTDTPGTIQDHAMMPSWVVSGYTTIQDYYSGRDLFETEIYDKDSWNVVETNIGGNAYQGSIFAFTYKSIDEWGGAESFREYVRKILAYYGMFFSDGVYNNVPETEDMDTVGCFLGTVDAQGITHGEYTEGTDNPDNLNYDWTDPAADTPYAPGGGGGGDDAEQPSDPYTPYPQPDNGFGICLSYYALQQGDYADLLDWIAYYADYDHAAAAYAAAGDTSFDTKYPDPAAWVSHVCERAGFNVYPTGDIVSLMCFPFELSGSDAGYQLGFWDTSIYHDHFNELGTAPLLTGKKMSGGYKYLDMGSMYIAPYYGDFRDYKPYSRIELQIPYHGTVDLDPADFVGYTVAVQIIVDYVTGSSLAIVKRVDSNGISAPVMTVPGQMGISVPITADSVTGTANTFAAMSTAYQSAKIGLVTDIASGAIGIAGGTGAAVAASAEGSVGGIISGVAQAAQGAVKAGSSVLQYGLSAKQQLYEMQHPQAGKMVMGTGSPSTSFAYEYRCRLVMHYPAMLPYAGADTFKALAGHACNVSGTVGDFSGFTQFGAVDLSGVSATPEEKAILLQQLQNGIFI